MDNDFRDEISDIRANLLVLQRRLLGLERRVSEQGEPAKEVARVPVPPPLPPVHRKPSRAVSPTSPGSHATASLLSDISRSAAAPSPRVQSVPEPSREKSGLSLEQRVGASWLNKIGIVVLILAAVFFFQYAAQQGWINPTIRVFVVALSGLVLLAAGEWTFRKSMRVFSAGVTGGGIALLYAAAYAASPKFYGLVDAPVAFGLMCAVTVVGVLLSIRSGVIATAILVQIGAYATPILLGSGRDEQVVLMTYLLALAAGFLTVSAVKKWNSLPLISLAGTLVLFVGWFSSYYHAPAMERTVIFAWALFGLFLIYAVAATWSRRAHQYLGITITAAGAAAMVLLWQIMDDFANVELLGQLIALNAIVLLACILRRWNWLRAGVLFWTALCIFRYVTASDYDLPGKPQFFSLWTWCFFGLFSVDLLIRAWWRNRRTNERLDAVIASLAMAGMFWATYDLLHESYESLMGLYTASLAVAAIGLGIVLIRLAKRRVPGYAYVGQGLVLLTLAMPIQFDKASLTVAWAAQAAVAMLLANRLRSRLLLAKSPIVLILAVVHFALIDVPDDSRLAGVMMSVGGVDIAWLMALAAGLTVSAFISAGLARQEKDGQVISGILLWIGVGVWGWQVCMNLPAVAASWWWMAVAAGVSAVGLWRRRDWLVGCAGAMLTLVAVKIITYDTLYRTMEGIIEAGGFVVLNWQFASGVVLGVICLLFARGFSRLFGGWKDVAVAKAFIVVMASLLVVWVGSFEVSRYFAKPPADLPVNADQARQMGYSIWWAIYAAGLLIVGFVARYSPLRYFSLAIFAVTLGKIFLIDMAGIEAGYRIASFLALGVLLVAASFLYQRYFRKPLTAGEK